MTGDGDAQTGEPVEFVDAAFADMTIMRGAYIGYRVLVPAGRDPRSFCAGLLAGGRLAGDRADVRAWIDGAPIRYPNCDVYAAIVELATDTSSFPVEVARFGTFDEFERWAFGDD